MKRLAIFLCVITLSGCSIGEALGLRSFQSQNSNNANYELLDMSDYAQAFEDLLNYMDDLTNGKDSDIELDTNLISNDLIASLSSVVSDHEGESTIAESGDEIDVYEGVDPEDPVHPILDSFGNLVGYGTLEESEESYKNYDELPNYFILNAEQYQNEIRYKVYNKITTSASIYVAELDKSNKIISYRELA